MRGEEVIEFVAQRLDSVLERTQTTLDGTINSGFTFLVRVAPRANRMRFMVPICRYNKVDDNGELAFKLLQANHTTAVDAKYTFNEGTIYATYMHPLNELSHIMMETMMWQTLNLASTHGTSFQSSNWRFTQSKLHETVVVEDTPTPASERVKKAKNSVTIPVPFLDPVTLVWMDDPVVTNSGHSFDRLTVEQIIRTGGNDPITRESLTMDGIRPNRALKEIMEAWLKLNDLAREDLNHE